MRQDEKRRIKNRAYKSKAKTLIKRLKAAVSANDSETAEKEMRLAHSSLDSLARRNIWHRNTVARKKSQLAKLVAQMKDKGPENNWRPDIIAFILLLSAPIFNISTGNYTSFILHLLHILKKTDQSRLVFSSFP